MKEVILNCINLNDLTLKAWASDNNLKLVHFSSIHDFNFCGVRNDEEMNDISAECVICSISSASSDVDLIHKALNSRHWGNIPVIFLVDNESVNFAVQLMKQGAWHVFDDANVVRSQRLFQEINSALEFSRAAIKKHKNVVIYSERREQLTCREREVMSLISSGLLNKQIADRLKISSRTVEIHRSRVFKKFKVKSAIDLVNLSAEAN